MASIPPLPCAFGTWIKKEGCHVYSECPSLAVAPHPQRWQWIRVYHCMAYWCHLSCPSVARSPVDGMDSDVQDWALKACQRCLICLGDLGKDLRPFPTGLLLQDFQNALIISVLLYCLMHELFGVIMPWRYCWLRSCSDLRKSVKLAPNKKQDKKRTGRCAGLENTDFSLTCELLIYLKTRKAGT